MTVPPRATETLVLPAAIVKSVGSTTVGESEPQPRRPEARDGRRQVVTVRPRLVGSHDLTMKEYLGLRRVEIIPVETEGADCLEPSM